MKTPAYCFVLVVATTLVISEDAMGKEGIDISASPLPITTIDPQHSWETLQLPPRTVEHLKALSQQVKKRLAIDSATLKHHIFQSGQTSVIFAGPYQKGKRAAAEAMANALKRPLLMLDIPMFLSRYIGETEKNLTTILNKAKKQEAILLFDEADALFDKRTESSNPQDRDVNQQIRYFLQLIERYPGLIIVNTRNLPTMRAVPISRNQSTIVFPCKPSHGCALN